MTTLTKTYSDSAVPSVAALVSAFDALPAARNSQDASPIAKAFVHSASTFQAELRNTIVKSDSEVVQDNKVAATARMVDDQKQYIGVQETTVQAQLAIADDQPAVSKALAVMLDAHKNYQFNCA